MESRIATLLGGDSSLDRGGLDSSLPLLPLPPPPSLTATATATAPRRPRPHPHPHPLEPPNTAGLNDEPRTQTSPDSTTDATNKNLHSRSSTIQRKRQKPSVPIAGVLNHEAPTSNQTHSSASAIPPPPLPPFSGRLSDLLLDPSQQHGSNKRRRLEEHAKTTPPNLTGSSDNKLKLPEPTQQPSKKTPKHPRIPPLLQGLHHPPPLPEKAFPPITSEGSSFGREIRERAGARSPVRSSNYQEKDSREDATREDESSRPRPERIGRDGGKPASASASDKENRENVSDKNVAPATKAIKIKETRKRNKWSEQETRDLLVGVSRFGIGNWKKILQCSDFTFNQRTAVDLKDRFRVCCPGDGLKLRKSRRKEDLEETYPSQDSALVPSFSSSTTTTSQDAPSQDVAPRSRRPRPETDRKGPVELAEMGIHAPFTKHKRRERREFTKDDDLNLLIGFDKYGTSWHHMRDDKELGFTGRHATDLRDRFRIRYPEKFAMAGCKPKAKDESMLKEKRDQTGHGSGDSNKSIDQATVGKDGQHTPKSKEASRMTPSSASRTNLATSVPPIGTTFRSHALREPLQHSFPRPLPDFVDLTSDGDVDGMHSPIKLNRNIFQWVEANPSTHMVVSTSSTSNMLAISSSFNANTPLQQIISASEGLDMDGTVTYSNVPMSLLTSSISTINSTVATTTTTSNPISATIITTAASKPLASSTNPLLRTPNLPTMMYPPVPVSSARSAVHNLPPPAHLLSGQYLDVRTSVAADPNNSSSSSQTATATTSFVLDEGGGLLFALPSAAAANGNGGVGVSVGMNGGVAFDPSATLAPMVGGGGAGLHHRPHHHHHGQGLFHLDRDLLDERFASSSVGGK